MQVGFGILTCLDNATKLIHCFPLVYYRPRSGVCYIVCVFPMHCSAVYLQHNDTRSAGVCVCGRVYTTHNVVQWFCVHQSLAVASLHCYVISHVQ